MECNKLWKRELANEYQIKLMTAIVKAINLSHRVQEAKFQVNIFGVKLFHPRFDPKKRHNDHRLLHCH